MGEVRADDKEVFRREIRFQRLRDPLQYAEPLRADNDRDDGRHLAKRQLQQRQLDLQAVLPVVRVAPVGEHALPRPDEFLAHGDIDRDLPQRGFRPCAGGLHAGAGEGHAVAGPEQENAFVRMPPRDAVQGRCGHFAAEHIAGVRDDDRLRGVAPGGGMQPGAGHGLDFPGGGGIEGAGDGGLPDFLVFGITGHRDGC